MEVLDINLHLQKIMLKKKIKTAMKRKNKKMKELMMMKKKIWMMKKKNNKLISMTSHKNKLILMISQIILLVRSQYRDLIMSFVFQMRL